MSRRLLTILCQVLAGFSDPYDLPIIPFRDRAWTFVSQCHQSDVKALFYQFFYLLHREEGDRS